MTERERLAEMIHKAELKMWGKPVGDAKSQREFIADYLLDHGVIAPPCKVGDTVYSPRTWDILEQRVEGIEIGNKPKVCVVFKCDYICDGCPHYQPYETIDGDGGCWGEYDEGTLTYDDFGKTVFITRKEAETELEERRKAGVE